MRRGAPRGLRQDQLAGAAGVGVRFLVELEAGKATAQIGKALAVLAALGCDLRIEAPGVELPPGYGRRRVESMTRAPHRLVGGARSSARSPRTGTGRCGSPMTRTGSRTRPRRRCRFRCPSARSRFRPGSAGRFFEGAPAGGGATRRGRRRTGRIAGRTSSGCSTGWAARWRARSRCGRRARPRLDSNRQDRHPR